MRFEVTESEIKQSNVPHELFLTNLIGNHILMAVSAGGMVGKFPWLMALVPMVSLGILSFTLWRARRSLRQDPWYVMCHWQICAKRSRFFIGMMLLALLFAALGWVGYAYGGMRKEAVIALLIGTSILPIMVTVLVLIMMESEALYHSNLCRLPNWVVEQFPNPDAKVVHEPEPA